jgi:hypothetical protein
MTYWNIWATSSGGKYGKWEENREIRKKKEEKER